ncbi:glycosyl transferase family 1 [Saccharothrix carnea]|uniref:Glycosyl transferase family 1 n=1 Tax=Saccharothrix carnea TaxID=1280637 RepID=A0A2P8IAC2_SACCR|nr:glycosyltransferase family 4 protein [Saccharothrix carnea]PSL55412.1 glycosyl transferase family 1 [Saccharothrix carnea]
MSVPTACTVTAERGLAAATVLAESYLRHHPGHRFAVAVLDGPHGVETRNGVTYLGPDRFGLTEDEFLALAGGHPLPQLAAAVKPWLLRTLLADAPSVTYLSPTSLVLGPLPAVTGLSVAPHFAHPVTGRDAESDEARLIGSGVHNPGYLVVTEPDLPELWIDAVLGDRVIRFDRDAFCDQEWFDQAVSHFPHTTVTDPGVGFGTWNAFERAGARLTLVDLLGFDPEQPWLLSTEFTHRPATLLSERPELRELTADYAERLVEAGWPAAEDVLPSWLDELPDGTPLTPLLREAYRAGVQASRAPRKPAPVPPHAFTGKPFRDWLTERSEHGVSRIATAIWHGRPDLRAVFGRPWSPGFAQWCRTSAVTEGLLPDWAVPGPDTSPQPPRDRFGVNLVGHLTAVLGVGELARVLHEALHLAAVPVASVVEDRFVANRTDLDQPDDVGRPEFPVSLLCVNADLVRAVVEQHPEVAHERYRIGVWSWELDEFPAAMHEFDCVDEVWTISEFARASIAAHTDKPVRVIPLPVRPAPAISPQRPEGPIRFLFAMDFNSVVARKNPFGAIEAFRRAFPDRRDVELVIKAINGDQHVPARERLRAAAAEDDRVTVLERYLTVQELRELYAGSHCYVSLHRSEGFGFTVAEAMALGLPVITTDYSGTAEFVVREHAWPVPYRMTEVGPGSPPYPPDYRWAEPDLDAAAAAMREVADDPERAVARGLAARERLLAERTFDTTAAWVRDRLAEAHATWRERRAPQPPPAPPAKTQRVVPLLRKAAVVAIDKYDGVRLRGRRPQR